MGDGGRSWGRRVRTVAVGGDRDEQHQRPWPRAASGARGGAVRKGGAELGDGAVADGAERAVDEHVNLPGGGVGVGVVGFAVPAALDLADERVVRDGRVAQGDDLLVIPRLRRGAGEAEREEATAGGELVQADESVERRVHEYLSPEVALNRRRCRHRSWPLGPHDSPGRRHALAVALEGRVRSAFGASVAANAPQLIVNPYARAANVPVGSAPPPEHETLLALSDAHVLR